MTSDEALIEKMAEAINEARLHQLATSTELARAALSVVRENDKMVQAGSRLPKAHYVALMALAKTNCLKPGERVIISSGPFRGTHIVPDDLPSSLDVPGGQTKGKRS